MGEESEPRRRERPQDQNGQIGPGSQAKAALRGGYVMSNNTYHHVGAGSQEFCSGCGKTKECKAVVETSGRIDCWCEECWDGFLGLAHEKMRAARRGEEGDDSPSSLKKESRS